MFENPTAIMAGQGRKLAISTPRRKNLQRICSRSLRTSSAPQLTPNRLAADLANSLPS
jgi:hypothetical protein